MKPASWPGRVLRSTVFDQTTYNSMVVLAGQLSRLMLGLISSALLARSLGPGGLAAFAVVGSTLMIAVSVADFGLSRSAVRLIARYVWVQQVDAQETAGSFARWKLVAGLIVTGFMVLLAAPLASFLDLPSSTGPIMIAIAAAGLLAASLSGIASAVLQAQARFKALIAGQLLNAGLTVLLMGALFFSNRLTIIPALSVGAITALAAAVFGFFILAPDWRQALLTAGSLRGGHSNELLAFSKWLWLSTVLTILATQADLLMVNRLLPPEMAGYYALALNLAFKADILNQALYTVLLPTASALSSRSEYLSFLRRNLTRSVLLCVLLIIAGMAAPLFISLVYGSAFAPSSIVFRWMLLITIFDLLVTPVLLLAFPLNLPRSITAANGLQVGLLLILGSQLIPRWGLLGAVAAKFVARAAGALLLGTAIGRRLPRIGSSDPAFAENGHENGPLS